MARKILPFLMLFALSCASNVFAENTSAQSFGTKPTSTQIAPRLSEPSSVDGLLQVTLGLFVVLMVIAGSAWLARRYGRFNLGAGGHLKVIGGLHMGARERLVLVQVGDKQLLLGVAPGRINTLHILDEPLPVETPPVAGEGFAVRLADVLRKRNAQ